MQIEVDLISALRGLARAGDLNSLGLLSHAERVTYISFRLGCEMGLTKPDLNELILSALVHDIGIITTQEKLQIADLEPQRDVIAAHCIRGHQLLKATTLFRHLATNVLEHHDYFTPAQRIIPAIIHLADRLDFALPKDGYYLLHTGEICDYFAQNIANRFHPAVVTALKAIGKVPSFWLDLQYGNFPVFEEEFQGLRPLLTLAELEELAKLTATIVDSKSPHTAAHSQGVARIAAYLGTKMGLPEDKVHLIKIAGLLHDLGKLAVPDEILSQTGPLNEKQRAIIKQHAYHTYYLIKMIGPGAAPLQRWASFHHERLDGTGYPFRLTAQDLEPEARIIAVADLVQALLETRPYRKGLQDEKVIQILQHHAQKGHIDSLIAELAIAYLPKLKELI